MQTFSLENVLPDFKPKYESMFNGDVDKMRVISVHSEEFDH